MAVIQGRSAALTCKCWLALRRALGLILGSLAVPCRSRAASFWLVSERRSSQRAAGGGKNVSLADSSTHPLILFDGVCNLCSASVQWIIRHDPAAIFHFATLQSREPQRLESIILLDGGREYRRSTAFLHILRRLPRLKWLAYVGATIPVAIRDEIYDLIATN